MISGCENCSQDSELPFDWDPRSADVFRSERDGLRLEVPARCLQCGAEINEKTLVDLRERVWISS